MVIIPLIIDDVLGVVQYFKPFQFPQDLDDALRVLARQHGEMRHNQASHSFFNFFIVTSFTFIKQWNNNATQCSIDVDFLQRQKLVKGDAASMGFQEQQGVVAARLTLQRLQGNITSVQRYPLRQPFVQSRGRVRLQGKAIAVKHFAATARFRPDRQPMLAGFPRGIRVHNVRSPRGGTRVSWQAVRGNHIPKHAFQLRIVFGQVAQHGITQCYKFHGFFLACLVSLNGEGCTARRRCRPLQIDFQIHPRPARSNWC